MTTSKNQYALAGDIGGTNMRAALVDSEGRITGRGSIGTLPERGIDDASERLARLLKAARATAPSGAVIAGVGVSTAGPIRPATGTYNHPPNLPGWNGKTMKPSLSESMGVPVWVGHDATLAALAETRFGDHVGAENLIYVTISTGVGGGIIANSEMVTGASGGAGEVGHLPIRTGAYGCNVGCDGCFEGNASGPAIARIARDIFTGKGPLAELCGGDPANITSRMVFDAADSGDPDHALGSLIGREFEHRSQQVDPGFANLELRRVHGDRDAAGAGGGVVPGQRPLSSFVESSLGG